VPRGLRVEPGSGAELRARSPDDHAGLAGKAKARKELAEVVEEIALLHNRLYAEGTRSLLLILQGLDASGKDGTVRSVLTGVNPQGCRIVSFREPSATELAHDYLWRVHAVTPLRGEIGIFNRSHYEDIVTARVHKVVPKAVWRRRRRHVREFERMLSDEGTTLVKVFLHLSRDEQRKRLEERLVNPEKGWKFRRSDLDDRARWAKFMDAYDDVIGQTSTEWAPWYVVPADHNWVRNLLVARILLDTLRGMDPQVPAPDPSLSEISIQ
jgi:PPK2 family polyphosphate:nucleotide phosphotransferase